MALELKEPLLWICSRQELFALAILLERHVCVSLVRIQVVVGDCPSYERSTWVSFHAGESIGSDIFSEDIIVPFSTTKSCLALVPK